jgi:hypothetical protein
MGRKGFSAVLIFAGVGLVALSLAADAMGLGAGYAFGWEQKLGVAVGTTVAWLSGAHLVGWRPRAARRPVESVQELRAPSTPVRVAA